LADQPPQSLIKLLVEVDTDRRLGIQIVSGHAAQIVQSLASLQMDLTKQALERALGIHPSSSEEFFSLKQSPNAV
jgi:glutathione reductase (NADPH)